MNGVPMKLDYSKTLNEQLDTFEYYKNRYYSYELELIGDRKEIERLNNIIDELDKWLDEESEKTILSTGHLTCLMMCKNKLNELKGDNK